MEASSVTNLLFNNLNFRGERQKVISSNIANINTPGYKTKELMFNEQMNEASKNMNLKLELANTNSKHLPKIAKQFVITQVTTKFFHATL